MSSKETVAKPFLKNVSLLLVTLLSVVGCSTQHGVSVVSHGEQDTVVEEPVSEEVKVTSSVPPIADSAGSRLAEVAEPPIVAFPPTENLTPIIPLPSLSADKEIVETDIFAQSAADSTLPWTLQDVFFDYDQMVVRRDAMPLLEQNAQVLLKRYADREVLLQGHCDERGTEAYNLILGERRAAAVKNYLVNLGVGASRLRVLSLGKSQPFCLPRTASCFQQNRRVHFVLQ